MVRTLVFKRKVAKVKFFRGVFIFATVFSGFIAGFQLHSLSVESTSLQSDKEKKEDECHRGGGRVDKCLTYRLTPTMN
jgi:hypothetical protein